MRHIQLQTYIFPHLIF